MKTHVSKWRLLLVTALLLLSGCAVQHVAPWERDLLAQQKMQLVPNPVENSLDEHIYFSKEASSGGQSVGGGGCGCN
jgi:hypothetical protein